MRGYGPSTYGDGFADVYDEWYAQVGDVEGCAAAIAAAHRDLAPPPDARAVLELGAGTGRLAAPLHAAGVPVVGVDASPAMLARFVARPDLRGVPSVCGDLARLPLRGPVAGGVLAFNTLFNLTTRAAQASVFREVARVLTPGGFLAAETFLPSQAEDDPDAVVEPTRLDLDRVVLTASIRDRSTQVVHGHHIELSERGITLRPWVIRYAAPDELDTLAAEAGLELVRREASWRGDPFDDHAVQCVSWWRRPPDGPTAGRAP